MSTLGHRRARGRQRSRRICSRHPTRTTAAIVSSWWRSVRPAEQGMRRRAHTTFARRAAVCSTSTRCAVRRATGRGCADDRRRARADRAVAEPSRPAGSRRGPASRRARRTAPRPRARHRRIGADGPRGDRTRRRARLRPRCAARARPTASGEIRSRFVVVADGANSRFGRALGTTRERDWPYGIATRSYWNSPRTERHVAGDPARDPRRATAIRSPGTAGSPRSATARSTSGSGCCRRTATCVASTR